MVRILITGSREWPYEWMVGAQIANFIANGLDRIPTVDGLDDIVVVHGDCPTGVDHFADIWAQDHIVPLGGTIERHPANWDRYGRAAGPKRNQEMVDLGANICLAFPMPGGRGTQDCIRRARKAGIKVIEFSHE
jgi:hypothetical protein